MEYDRDKVDEMVLEIESEVGGIERGRKRAGSGAV
jgi:hypothetical protein